MKLRIQLALVCLTLVTIPWTGCQFIRSNEHALLALQQQGLEATGLSIAHGLANQVSLFYPDPRRATAPEDPESLIVTPANQPPVLDGYLDDWTAIPFRDFGTPRNPTQIAVTQLDNTLFIALKITDLEKQYGQVADGGSGDRLVLRTWTADRRQDYVLATSAPGSVRARILDRALPGASPERIRGQWADVGDGYQVEFKVPVNTAGSRLGFYYIDVGDGGITHRGNITPLSTSAPPWLIRADNRLTQLAANYDGSSTSIQILDRWGWPLAASTPTAPEPVPAGLWLSRWLYRLILDDPQINPAPLLTQSGQLQDEVVDQAIRGHAGHTLINQDGELRSRFAAPIVGPDGILGVIVGEQPRERYLSLTDSAFNGLVVKGSIALLLTVLALLSFALLVGRRLSKLTQQIGDHRKHVTQQPLVVSPLGDEIDDLAETFNSLMQEQQQLEDYLRALPRSLAHEIRTPVAIISASLEQLSDSTSSDAERDVIIHRASEGVQRLRNMLDSMNEANRLETSLASESKEPIDLANLLTQLRDAYEQTFPAWRFEFDGMDESADMSGAPDAIVQALDKLVSNATSFTPEGGLISLKLERRGLWWRIAISNPGPALPADPLRLFSPMVTSRAGSDSQGSHMGLGLYIVRLVAEYHGGEPWAQNRADGSGAEVGFTVRT